MILERIAQGEELGGSDDAQADVANIFQPPLFAPSSPFPLQSLPRKTQKANCHTTGP